MTRDKEIIRDDEYIAVLWPDIQEYMDLPRWDEVGFDADKNLWFVPKDMIKYE